MTPMPKVLIVEDDEVIAQGMARHLGAAGFDPVWVGNGDQGLARLRYEKPDVCVLDLMLPGLDGWKLIETVRAEGIGTPIVVVSARGTEHDRVHALEIGADDYLVKPFSMKELVARVRAAARRGIRRDEAPRGEPIEIEELGSTRARCRPTSTARAPSLTPTEFRLALPARARARPRLDAGRAAAEAVGPPRVAPRPHGRRLRPAPAREDRPARVAPHLHPDALRRRLQARGGAEGSSEPASRHQGADAHGRVALAARSHSRSGMRVRRRRSPTQRDEPCARRRRSLARTAGIRAVPARRAPNPRARRRRARTARRPRRGRRGRERNGGARAACGRGSRAAQSAVRTRRGTRQAPDRAHPAPRGRAASAHVADRRGRACRRRPSCRSC